MLQAFFKVFISKPQEACFWTVEPTVRLGLSWKCSQEIYCELRWTKTGEWKLLISYLMSRNVTFVTTGDADGSKCWSPPGGDAAIGTWPSWGQKLQGLSFSRNCPIFGEIAVGSRNLGISNVVFLRLPGKAHGWRKRLCGQLVSQGLWTKLVIWCLDLLKLPWFCCQGWWCAVLPWVQIQNVWPFGFLFASLYLFVACREDLQAFLGISGPYHLDTWDVLVGRGHMGFMNFHQSGE